MPDPRLIAAGDQARAALEEITPADTIGDPADYKVEAEGVVSLRFANKMRGYPGWFWVVTLAVVGPEDAPTVLEVELLPGDGALVAPEWIPWSERIADYRAAKAQAKKAGLAGEASDDDDASDDSEDLLDSDDDELYGGLDDSDDDGDSDDDDDLTDQRDLDDDYDDGLDFDFEIDEEPDLGEESDADADADADAGALEDADSTPEE